MNVLIVGRTKMGDSPKRCIGGLCEDGRSVRLLDDRGNNWDVTSEFRIGQVWDLDFMNSNAIVSPHVEDVRVTGRRFVRLENDVKAAIVGLVQPWTGSPLAMFDGLIKYTGSRNGYVESPGPDRSTWFWVPDRDLGLRFDKRHYDYPSPVAWGTIQQGLSYVGEAEPLNTIVAGTLVRVSLARWWKPRESDPTFPERCYLQLSGWF